MKKASLLVAALFLLGACASHDVAARVGGETISSADVDTLTKAECTLAGMVGQQATAQPVRQRRTAALGQLIDLEIFQLAAQEGGDYDKAAYAGELARLRQEIAVLPGDVRERTEEIYADYIKGILQLREASLASLAAQGIRQPDQAQLEAELQARYAAAREGVEIEINPAYSPDGRGIPGSQDGSLSVAVSDYAKQAGAAQPDPEYVGGLAPKLLCG